MSVEIWKPITGWEGLYSISNHGRVWVHDRVVRRVHTGPYHASGKLLAPRKGNQHGHLCVTLYRGPHREKKYVHQLVAEAFIPREEGKPWVLHGPKGSSCNRVTNLRWGTHSDNERDKQRWPDKTPTRRNDQLITGELPLA